MGLVFDPAALGGLAGLIAVASWALGRIHGSRAGPARPDRAGMPADVPSAEVGAVSSRAHGGSNARAATSPCQQRAQEERRALLSRPVALAELHAEVTAIRRDERILERAPDSREPIILRSSVEGGAAVCRYIGLSGRPTCPAATRSACPDRQACGGMAAEPMMPALSDRM
ncbi:hypothetical protein OIK40_12845 [Erythrobacter sp. sf7]|uniref:Uncharacterized protein n=1 Tax=Erythrobacter fulvus TaxID=2987523 RepID=A0ABT5JTP1_9SPHN|nr:hypothetical protein [Erythrobacter fulvus]MDC8755530.1 hypothetical protein [Erythrobacter fulvus]